MAEIIRTPSKAHGGITPDEKLRMDEHAKLWIARGMRTDPIEPDKIIPAIKGIYAAANLKEPRVIIVPSPMVMAFAYGASAAIWHVRKTGKDNATDIATYNATYNATDIATANATDNATYNATYIATRNATDIATYIATDNATDIATDNATYNSTYNATDIATYIAENGAASACFDLAGSFGIECAKRWGSNYQGGNMWAGYDCYLTSCRDILGLELTSHAAYAHWEQAAIHGGFRVMHEEFCLVSDFPEVLRVDDQNRPHCETGPSHRWRDGWALHYWHGVKVPAEWIENKKSLTPAIALGQQNAELRRAACEIIGWANILKQLDAKVIDADGDPEIGTLIRVDLPEARGEQFLQVKCGTRRDFALPVPPDMKTALAAQAWLWGLDEQSFIKPEIRT